MGRWAGRHEPEPAVRVLRHRHGNHVVLDGWRGGGSLRRRKQIGNCAAQEVRASGSAQPVMKPGGFEIEVESYHAFAERGQKPCGVGQQEGAACAALVRVESYGLHGAQAAKPKAPASRKRRARSLASRRL
jgi:hypothetical protein